MTGSCGLVIGSEGFGISRLIREKCDFMIRLPMLGRINSLNASVAAGIYKFRGVITDICNSVWEMEANAAASVIDHCAKLVACIGKETAEEPFDVSPSKNISVKLRALVYFLAF